VADGERKLRITPGSAGRPTPRLPPRHRAQPFVHRHSRPRLLSQRLDLTEDGSSGHESRSVCRCSTWFRHGRAGHETKYPERDRRPSSPSTRRTGRRPIHQVEKSSAGPRAMGTETSRRRPRVDELNEARRKRPATLRPFSLAGLKTSVARSTGRCQMSMESAHDAAGTTEMSPRRVSGVFADVRGLLDGVGCE